MTRFIDSGWKGFAIIIVILVAVVFAFFYYHEYIHVLICQKYGGTPDAIHIAPWEWRNASPDALPGPWTRCYSISMSDYSAWLKETKAWDMQLENDVYDAYKYPG